MNSCRSGGQGIGFSQQFDWSGGGILAWPHDCFKNIRISNDRYKMCKCKYSSGGFSSKSSLTTLYQEDGDNIKSVPLSSVKRRAKY